MLQIESGVLQVLIGHPQCGHSRGCTHLRLPSFSITKRSQYSHSQSYGGQERMVTGNGGCSWLGAGGSDCERGAGGCSTCTFLLFFSGQSSSAAKGLPSRKGLPSEGLSAVVGAADADVDCCCSSLVHDLTDWLVHDVQLTAADWPVNDVPLTGWSMIDGLSYNGYTLHA